MPIFCVLKKKMCCVLKEKLSLISTKNMKVSEEFSKIMKDFVSDMKSSFPEYAPIILKYESNLEYLHAYCVNVYPSKFVDILYKSEDLFDAGNQTEFLPGISFSFIWHYEDLSLKNKNMIWNYLQMLMITLVGEFHVEPKPDDDQLLETLQSKEFSDKLAETITSLQMNFQSQKPSSQTSQPFEELMDTKLAHLAKEIAEETTADFQEGLEDIKDVNGVFQHIMKDPTKLLNIVKNVGEKLDNKMKSGDLNEAEILSEATTLMNKMKDIPGMDNIQEMMKKMAPTIKQQQHKQQQHKQQQQKRRSKPNISDNQYLNQLYDEMIRQQKQRTELEKTL
jgi:hypothetical protein